MRPSRFIRRPLASPLFAIATLLLLGSRASAATVVLDGASGADYDAVGDGWFFGPLDGQGDLGGQQLALGFVGGIVDLRAMAEFPLAPLASFTAAQVASATLTFKIDDVIGTFGPGADFDGTASDPITVSTYPADGMVNVSDFSPAGLAQVEIVATGTITDAMLASSGAVQFDVDVTQELRSARAASSAALGAHFATSDSPTATSIDDLGVAGARLPYLTVTLVAATPTPAPTATPTATPVSGTATPTPASTPTLGAATPTPASTPTLGAATPTPASTPTLGAATPTPGPGATPTATGGPVGTPTPGKPVVTPTLAPGTTPTPVAATPVTPAPGAPTPGGPTPLPTASGALATPFPTSTPAVTPSAGATPSGAPPTPTHTPAPGVTPTASPGATPAPTSNPGATSTPSPVASPPSPPPVRSTVSVPSALGDQLVFPLDTRLSAECFLNLHNAGNEPLEVRVLAYGADLAAPVEQRFALAALATRTIDAAELRGAGLAEQVGLAVAVAVDDEGKAIVTRALSGSFTIGDLGTGAAWGASAAGRNAVASTPVGVRLANLGTRIDDRAVRLQRIQPEGVTLPVYYDPLSLRGTDGGSLLLFLSFADATDGSGGVTPAVSTWVGKAARRDGSPVQMAEVEANGVLCTDLTTLLGPAAGGSAGGMSLFLADAGNTSQLVYFAMSLDSFAAGYLLPAIED